MRLSICGATRRVQILNGLGDLVDPEARRLRIYISVRPSFSLVQRFFCPQLRDRETFRFWHDDWSGHGRLCGVFPRLYALSTGLGALVRRAWHNAWVPALPTALFDQRVVELLNLQELLANRRPEAAHDTWVWSGPSFTSQAAYRLLQDQKDSEDLLLLQ